MMLKNKMNQSKVIRFSTSNLTCLSVVFTGQVRLQVLLESLQALQLFVKLICVLVTVVNASFSAFPNRDCWGVIAKHWVTTQNQDEDMNSHFDH